MEGCTIPAVPPMPSTLCGTLGSTPPMGIRQYSSSSMLLQAAPDINLPEAIHHDETLPQQKLLQVLSQETRRVSAAKAGHSEAVAYLIFMP